jgi:glyoxylase-like metal-dependent hydrolase (beta-lactamase superfamily II)/rhodanese-related sulfurtransferase
MIFRQLFDYETYTYTYLLADEDTREAILIDPVKEQLDRDLKLLKELKLKLKYSLETHVHADHITSANDIRERTGAKTVVSFKANVECADIRIQDSETLELGKYILKALYTPGHTDTCMSYLIEDMIFTGDAILNRGTGRTDFQSGSSETLYNSIKHKIFSLPDKTIIYPGHDYKGLPFTTVAEEKEFNPRINLKITEAEFIETMSNLKLANPKKIHEAVPANLLCGISQADKESSSDKLYIDVRSQDEHLSSTIPGAICVPHDEIEKHLSKLPRNKTLVLFCRSGGRQSKARQKLSELGYTGLEEVEGGFLAWSADPKNPVQTSRKAIPIQRQVMITAGLLILVSSLLGVFSDKAWFGLTIFVGAGLSFAGLSGFCGMAMLLEKMPWNKTQGSSGSCSI